MTKPIENIVAVTTSDADNLAEGACRGIYVGGAGNVRITTKTGQDVVLHAMAVGVIHWVSAKKIWATNTTATNIRALY